MRIEDILANERNWAILRTELKTIFSSATPTLFTEANIELCAEHQNPWCLLEALKVLAATKPTLLTQKNFECCAKHQEPRVLSEALRLFSVETSILLTQKNFERCAAVQNLENFEKIIADCRRQKEPPYISAVAKPSARVSTASMFPSKRSVEDDKRFVRSSELGVLYLARSSIKISEAELFSYGFYDRTCGLLL